MREFVGRFGETIHRPQPFLFYLPHLLHKFAPWSVLIVTIAIFDLRSRNWGWRELFRDMSPETLWLLCWSIGGLVVMSLIPSKRVDRIFPVIPPLCLLLAAQFSPRNSCSQCPVGRASRSTEPNETAHGAVATRTPLLKFYRWSPVALAFAILFAGGYTGWKVITGYRNHRDALAVLGRRIRHEAQARHWRYEVVSAKDEGLLVYLQKTHFVKPAAAAAEWKAGNLDALVASTEKATALVPKLQGAFLLESKEWEARGYVLITR